MAKDGCGPPVLMVSARPRPGISGLSLHRTGMMAMLHGLRGQFFRLRCAFFYFWSRARPENALLSGLFVLSPGPNAPGPSGGIPC